MFDHQRILLVVPCMCGESPSDSRHVFAGRPFGAESPQWPLLSPGSAFEPRATGSGFSMGAGDGHLETWVSSNTEVSFGLFFVACWADSSRIRNDKSMQVMVPRVILFANMSRLILKHVCFVFICS